MVFVALLLFLVSDLNATNAPKACSSGYVNLRSRIGANAVVLSTMPPSTTNVSTLFDGSSCSSMDACIGCSNCTIFTLQMTFASPVLVYEIHLLSPSANVAPFFNATFKDCNGTMAAAQWTSMNTSSPYSSVGFAVKPLQIPLCAKTSGGYVAEMVICGRENRIAPTPCDFLFGCTACAAAPAHYGCVVCQSSVAFGKTFLCKSGACDTDELQISICPTTTPTTPATLESEMATVVASATSPSTVTATAQLTAITTTGTATTGTNRDTVPARATNTTKITLTTFSDVDAARSNDIGLTVVLPTGVVLLVVGAVVGAVVCVVRSHRRQQQQHRRQASLSSHSSDST
jgi:hypothetical protein